MVKFILVAVICCVTISIQDSDKWSAHDHESKYSFLSEVVSTDDAIIVFREDGKIDWWQMDRENGRLKKQCVMPNPKAVALATVFPRSKFVIFVREGEPSQFSFYDLQGCITWKTKLDLMKSITKLQSAENKILVATSSDTANYITSWTGRSVVPIPEVAAVYDAALGRGGLVAYHNDYERRKLNFFNVANNREQPSIEVDFDFTAIEVTASGSYTALQDDRQERFAVYEVYSKKKVFDSSSMNFGRLLRISDDGKSVAFIDGSDIVTLVQLNLDGSHNDEPKFSKTLYKESVFVNSAIFRTIGGTSHFQTVGKSGVLRIYKLSESGRIWNLI